MSEPQDERTQTPQPNRILTEPATTQACRADYNAAALHWAAVATGLAEARTAQGHPLTNDERTDYDRYQAAAHAHGFTEQQVRDYLNDTLRPAMIR